AGQRGLGEGFLEGVEAAEVAVDALGHFTGRIAAALGRHHRPEQRMVGVATGVVAQRAALVFGQRVEVGNDLLGALVGPLGAFKRGVGIVDIGLVVLGVVDFHRLRVDVGLERVVGVRQFGKDVGHGGLLGGNGRQV